MSTESPATLKRRESVHVQNLPDGSALLFDTATAIAYPITESAARIWDLCDGTRPANQIIDELNRVTRSIARRSRQTRSISSKTSLRESCWTRWPALMSNERRPFRFAG